MPLVVDASAIVPLALADEDAVYSERVLIQVEADGFCVAPPIFFDEVYNVLLSAERRGRIERSIADEFLERLIEELPLLDDTAPNRAATMQLARRAGTSFYDALYL